MTSSPAVAIPSARLTHDRVSPWPTICVFGFVFLVRLVVLTRLASSPFLFPTEGDMHFYDDWAKEIVHGKLTDGLAFYGLPLYAYSLAFLYKVFGYNPFIPGLLQIVSDAATATLLYQIGYRIGHSREGFASFDHRANAIGILAAIVWAFCVPAQAYSVVLMPTSLGVFIYWFLVWIIMTAKETPKAWLSLALGVVAGIAAMAVATILFIVAFFIGALFLRAIPSEKGKQSKWLAPTVSAILFLFGVGLGTSPCWIHNYIVARDPVFLSAHSGVNFWIGNNPEATGYPKFPGMHAAQAAMLKDSIDIAEATVGRNLKRSEVSQFWSEKARSYIRDNVAAWLRLLGSKFVNFWNAFEYDDINVIEKLSSRGILFPGLHFGFIAALALPGFCFAIRSPSARWAAFAVLLQLAAVLPVFITERYRLAAVPGLVLLAAAGIYQFWEDLAQSRIRRVATYLTVLTLTMLFVTWPQRDPALWGLKLYHSGLQALEQKQWPLAQERLESAYAYAPGSTEVNLALGNLWLEQNDFVRAENYYLAVLKTDSKHKSALNNLGLAAISQKNWERAAEYLKAAIHVDPNDAKSHYLYARARFEAGDLESASIEAQAALQLEPAQPEFKDFYETVQKHR
jgi:tetratricopeptide (TPR) repeat protein